MTSHALEQRFSYRFAVLASLNVKCTGRVYIEKFGLSAAGWRVLSVIGRLEPIFPGVASQLTTIDADKMTRTVARLVKAGYVIRNTDGGDRRRVILCLTSQGRSVYEEVDALHQKMDAAWRVALSAAENASLDRIMDKLEERARELFRKHAGATASNRWPLR